jgi:hypothetical protein
MIRAHEILELTGFLGSLPDIQIIPLNIPGMKTTEGKNQKALSMGVFVPSIFRSLLKYILHTISEDMDQQRYRNGGFPLVLGISQHVTEVVML